jgi:tripartite ATP-independent transporter DctM subunit
MSNELITFLIFSNLIFFLLAGFPVVFSLMGVSISWMLILQGPRILSMVPATIYDTGTTEIFVAAPLFILMAISLERVGIGVMLYDAIHKWTEGIPGGLAVGTVIAAALIAAMTGIGGTAVLVLGVLAVPEMIRRGYDVKLAIGGLPPGGALGVLIPPTVIGVLLGGFAGIPVGHLFFGAALPGILIALLYCIYIIVRCKISPHLAPVVPVDQRSSLREKIYSLRQIALPVLLISIVLGSIWLGVATPSEAAGIGAFGTLLIALVRGQLGFKALRQILSDSANVSVMVLALLVGGALFSRLLQLSGSARLVSQYLVGIELGIYGTLIIFMAVVTLLGMFIDGAAIIFIVTPIMMPAVKALGIDPVWFGVMMMIAIAAGYVTPPFGMNLFYLRGILHQIRGKEGMEPLHAVTVTTIWAAILPYVIIMFLVLGAVMVWPELATWLPKQLSAR